eukprot:3468928-Ditylum_brightwellii.AAC.1
MSSNATQSNTETHQLAFTAKETHSKGSTSKKYSMEDSFKEREKSVASKFVLRNLSVQKGSTQRMIQYLPDATNITKDRNTKSWTINKLQFSQ